MTMPNNRDRFTNENQKSKTVNELKQIASQLPEARRKFEMSVSRACLEVADIAREITPAIGEISIEEAKEVILREFNNRLDRV